MPQPRVYALATGPDLTPEQLAVTFAMTSRNPNSFDDIAAQVSVASSAAFHEKWVVGYGHSSVAEHAVLHLAVENHSRLAVDQLEAGRLASYTEKSSRYQEITEHYPPPDHLSEKAKTAYSAAAATLIRTAGQLHTEYDVPRDQARQLLPAATLTNVGVTMNARSAAQLIVRLLSHPLAEVRALGESVKSEAQRQVPTLVRHTEPSPRRQLELAEQPDPVPDQNDRTTLLPGNASQELLNVLLALRCREHSANPMTEYIRILELSPAQQAAELAARIGKLEPHDPGPRELELANFNFLLRLDYGAWREFQRHRMLTALPQPPTINLGRRPLELLPAGAAELAESALEQAESAHEIVAAEDRHAARYLVTHCHWQRAWIQANLRELRHLFRLRTGPKAHRSIREPVNRMQEELRCIYPELIDALT